MGKQCKCCGAEINVPRRIFCNEDCRVKYYNRQRMLENYRLLEEQRKIKEAGKETESKRSKPKKAGDRPPAILKNKEVCKGCKYLYNGQTTDVRGLCDYLEVTGHSRILAEMEHGGVKADSCCCYETGKRKSRKKGICY